ncbi:MAG: adenylate/guanylate cyclase domain-containing protein [bacterium]|nr:adenylate/guanylate cyclase domain-containing protein [bacterium]
MKGFLVAAALGGITFLSLNVFPYFPKWWSFCFGLIICLIGWKFVRFAIVLAISTISITIAYHSIELFLCYIVVALFFLIVTIWFSDFPEMFLLVAGTSFLATSVSLKTHIPLEFLIVILAPLLLKNKGPVIAGVACFWCCILGIITQQEIMGYVVVGAPVYKFYSLKEVPLLFYNFSWFQAKANIFFVDDFYKIITNLGKFLLSQPLIIFQAIIWGMISYYIELFIREKKWWLDLIGVVSGAGLVILLDLIVIMIYPGKINFDLSTFLYVGVPIILVILTLWKLMNWMAGREVPSTEYAGEEVVFSDNVIPESAAGGKNISVDKLSLEESLKMQNVLSEHIQKKFIHEVTAMDIDIVESTALKQNELHENIIFSFTEFWKFADIIIQNNHGRLLSRAGDEAMYLFEDVNKSVSGAQQLLDGLDKFNKTTNLLKLPFNVRLGLNTGKIVEDQQKGGNVVFSKITDIAGHLQKMALPGEILISGHTYDKLQNKKEFKSGKYSQRDKIEVYTLKEKSVEIDIKK